MVGLVYSYSRFSDPRQAAGHSLERQAAFAARWAADHGLVLDVALTMRDEGLSAYHQAHIKSGALGIFLAAVNDGKIAPGSVLVVEGLDRLSRAEPIQAQGQLAAIVNAGITVVTASDGKEYSRERLKANPMDLVYSLLVMIRAHEESDTKSKRVVASIRRSCEGWVAGTYRGLIRNGRPPAWVELVDGAWQIVPARAEAALYGIELYRRGYGATRIVRELHERGLSLTGRGAVALQIYRLIHQRALIGEMELEIGGEAFRLVGYYPALMTAGEFDDLQTLMAGRGRRRAKGPVPHILTGMGITTCGYCGRALVGQNLGTRNRRADGGIMDGHRRLICTSNAHGEGCPVLGSISVAPVERALMSYCSDIVNLQSLYGDADLAAGPRAQRAAARDKANRLGAQLDRLTDVMLAAAADGLVPATFTARARKLEAELARARTDEAAADRALAAAARTDIVGTDRVWAGLAAGVEAQDYDTRLRVRQMIADTFVQIVVYHAGFKPGGHAGVGILLVAKGGIERRLEINQAGAMEDAQAGEVAGLPADFVRERRYEGAGLLPGQTDRRRAKRHA